MEGLVVKLLAGVYTVRLAGEQMQCKAKGTFRNDGVHPLVGDRVTVDTASRLITAIGERKNAFIRPAVANVDCLCIVLAPGDPKPDLLMVDKLIATAMQSEVQVILCINKCDVFAREAQEISRQYAGAGVTVLCVSAREGTGLDELRCRLQGRFTCFTGQSAVGKSSLMNALFPELALQTGGLSKKTARGRHTTRHLEIFTFGDMLVADTPGFSLLDCPEIDPGDFGRIDPLMRRLSVECKFIGCEHDREPGCAVKACVGREIAPERYERYITILNELREKKRTQYD